MSDLVEGAGAFLVFVALPAGGTALLVRTYGRWCSSWLTRQRESLGERGRVWGPGLLFRVAIFVSLLPALLLTLTILLLGIGVIADDSEMTSVGIRLGLAVLPLLLFLAALTPFALTLWVIEKDRLTRHRRWLPERSINFVDMSHMAEGEPLRGLLISSNATDGPPPIRISKQVEGYSAIFDRLAAEAPQLLDQRVAGGDGTRDHYRVPRWRPILFSVLAFFLLLLMLAWPWFLVVGEHQTRDSFIFVGIGMVVWVAGCTFFASTWLQPGTPWSLELGDHELTMRFLRRVESRSAKDLRDVSVETRIVKARGQSGYRYPLLLHFADGSTVEIDDVRSRQMGSSTQEMAAVLRGRYPHIKT